MKDQKLIYQLRKGNHKVFEELYEFFPMIENMILKNNGNKEIAKDIFQNTLIVFYKKTLDPKFKLTSGISTYLYAVAQNMWLKQLTKLRLHRLNKESEELLPSLDPDIEEEAPTLPLKEYLIKKLNELGEPCLSIIMLHTYQKLSMKLITEKMGYANEHTTRQQKYKCLLRLKKIIPEVDKNSYLL